MDPKLIVQSEVFINDVTVLKSVVIPKGKVLQAECKVFDCARVKLKSAMLAVSPDFGSLERMLTYHLEPIQERKESYEILTLNYKSKSDDPVHITLELSGDKLLGVGERLDALDLAADDVGQKIVDDSNSYVHALREVRKKINEMSNISNLVESAKQVSGSLEFKVIPKAEFMHKVEFSYFIVDP